MAGGDARISDWRRRFQQCPLARTVVIGLEGRAQEIWRRTFDLLRKESPEYRNAVDDEFTAESKNHCGELLRTIIAIAGGRLSARDPFAFVRRHAEWRARHQVPLVASLHAYRLAHKTYWSITREPLAKHGKEKEALQAMGTLSDFWIELFEAVGAALEDAHGAEEARMVAQNTGMHAEVIEQLLRGREPMGAEARHLLALCGMHPMKQVTVALVRPLAADGANHSDAQVARRSLVRLLHQVLPSSIFGRLIGTRDGEIVVIANADGDTSARMLRHLKRGGMAAGVGLEKTTIADLPEALDEARIALDLTGSGRAAMRFADADLAEAVIQRTDRALLRLAPEWVRRADGNGQERELLRTISAFADCSLNVKATASRLGVHTNTVYFQLNQIRRRTGVDPRTFAGLSSLVTALQLLKRRHL